jgi:hypothetical protein
VSVKNKKSKGNMHREFTKRFALLAGLGLSAGLAVAGPVIIDGTDANDHGFVSGGVNQDGWRYMQSALQNIGGAVGNGNKIVVNLGTSGSQAGAAINSAFTLSSLVPAGWTMVTIDGAANIGSFLAGNTVGGVNLTTAGLLYLPTSGLSSGDADSSELAQFNANAGAIASFVSGGGGLFAMGETGVGKFGWLSTLIAGITVTDIGGGGSASGLNLTPAGAAAFPGLPNSEVQAAIPWHEFFGGNLGSLSVLGVGDAGQAVIIGGGAGTVIQTNPVPETVSLAFTAPFLAGLLFLGGFIRRQKA